MQDIESNLLHSKPDNILDVLKCRFLTFKQWEKIDQHELNEGSKKGKVRSKLTSVDKMLEIGLS